MNCLLRNDELEVIVDELLWNWLTCVLLSRIYNYGICWVEDWDIELLMIKEWFELLGLWIEIYGYRLKWWICELFVFWW